jgi:uncharacterized protein
MNPFLKLIQTGATAEIADAIERDPALAEYRDPQGVSALLWAIYMGQALVRDYLLERLAAHGALLDVYEAAALGDIPRLNAILSADSEAINLPAGDGWTPLHLAVAFGSPEAAEVLLAHGALVNAVSQNAQHNQPLHAALALGRNPATVQLLLDKGADPNARQTGGYTPLFSAAASGQRELVELLLRGGADPSLTDDSGKTAAQFTRDRGHAELGDWLASWAG